MKPTKGRIGNFLDKGYKYPYRPYEDAPFKVRRALRMQKIRDMFKFFQSTVE
jgi:hypothetical protein